MLRRLITALFFNQAKYVKAASKSSQSSRKITSHLKRFSILDLIKPVNNNNIRKLESDLNYLQKSIGGFTGMSSIKESSGGRRVLFDSENESTSDHNGESDNKIRESLSSDKSNSIQELDDLKEFYAKSRKELSSGWQDYANKSCYIYLYKGGGDPNNIIAAFDLDGTLIKPKSNKKIPRSATDWDLFSVWTKIKLQQVIREHRSRFVIFTNQNGVGLNIVPLEEVQERIELITKRLDIPCTVFMAIEKDEFRKPGIGMFKLFLESFNESKPLDYEKSFYCGDAVGYPSHSDADIRFAQKLSLPFLPPEKFLRGVKPKLLPLDEKVDEHLEEKQTLVNKS